MARRSKKRTRRTGKECTCIVRWIPSRDPRISHQLAYVVPNDWEPDLIPAQRLRPDRDQIHIELERGETYTILIYSVDEAGVRSLPAIVRVCPFGRSPATPPPPPPRNAELTNMEAF